MVFFQGLHPSSGLLAPASGGELTEPALIKVGPSKLAYQDLLRLVAGLPDAPGCGPIVFDFSGVDEFTTPWTVHFAILIHLARQRPGGIVIRGLHGGPREMANFYRGHSEMRGLLREAAPPKPC